MLKFIKYIIGKLIKFAVILCIIGLFSVFLYIIFKPVIEENNIPVLSSIDSMYEAYLTDNYSPVSSEEGMKIVRGEIERLTKSNIIKINGKPMKLKVGEFTTKDEKPIKNIKDTIIHDGYIKFIAIVNGQEQHKILVLCKWDEKNQTIKLENKKDFWNEWIVNCAFYDYGQYTKKKYGRDIGSEGPVSYGEIRMSNREYGISFLYKYKFNVLDEHLFSNDIAEVERTIYTNDSKK